MDIDTGNLQTIDTISSLQSKSHQGTEKCCCLTSSGKRDL